MKLKKIAFIMVFVLSLGLTNNVYAMERDDFSKSKPLAITLSPYWSNTSSIDILVEKTDSGLKACAIIIPKRVNEKVKGTLYLQKYKNGKWSTVKSWGFSGKGYTSVMKPYSTKYGKYRSKVRVNVGGEYITMYSFEKQID